MKYEVDRKTIKILLAALELEVGELAEHMGYDYKYVVNVFNGFTQASFAFRKALGETIACLLLGPYDKEIVESYPAAPLVAWIEAAAAGVDNKRDFYQALGTSAQVIRNRKRFDGIFVDRICCALGVHPSSVYGRDYDAEVAS